MNQQGIEELMRALGEQEHRLEGGWVQCSCPVAFARHKHGHDSNPSFGIMIVDDGRSGYHCFSGSQKFLTPSGWRDFVSTVGSTQTVLGRDGKWHQATVEAFGVQPVAEVVFRPGSSARRGHSSTSLTHKVEVTSNHRWFTQRGLVTDLRVGDQVAFQGPPSLKHPIADAWVSGFGFGDGTLDARGRARVRLSGKKMQHLPMFEKYAQIGGCFICYPPSAKGEPVVVFNGGRFGDWKKLPPLSKGVVWLASWLEGYLAADGHTIKGVQGLSSQNAEAIDFVKAIAPFGGYMVSGQHTMGNLTTNYGPRAAPLKKVNLKKAPTNTFKVVSIGEAKPAKVYCVVEPETTSFVLEHGITTGNCFSCGFKGRDLGDMLVEVAHYVRQYEHKGIDLAKARQIADQENDIGYMPHEWTDDSQDKLFEPWPEWYLDRFPRWSDHSDCLDYLKSRKVLQTTAKALDLRYDPRRDMVCFPVRDREGFLSGLRGRSLKDKKYHDYVWNGVNNTSVTLYGEHQLNPMLPVVVVEGPFDYAAVWPHYHNVAAIFMASINKRKMATLQCAVQVLAMTDDDMAGEQVYWHMRDVDPNTQRIELPALVDKKGNPIKNDPGNMTVAQIRNALSPYVKLIDKPTM